VKWKPFYARIIKKDDRMFWIISLAYKYVKAIIERLPSAIIEAFIFLQGFGGDYSNA
jgi:hypothetical protein